MIELPPLHLRCRCVIIYREIEGSVLRSAPNNGKMNHQEGDSKIEWLNFNESKRLTDTQYKDLRKFANDRKIELSGFKKSDVDVNLMKDTIIRVCVHNRFINV